MEIITKEKELVTAGMLDFGDTFASLSGRIFMVVDGDPYIEDDCHYGVLIVDLKEGVMDRISKNAVVRPVKLIANEE